MDTYQIIFICVFAIALVIYLTDRFTGHKILFYVVQWRPVLVAMTAFCDAVANALPSSYFYTAAMVLKAASDAAQQAEKLYLMGELPKEERNEYAQLLIASALRDAGIGVTEQIQEIIDGCIAVVCMLMPHGIEPIVPEGELAVA